MQSSVTTPIIRLRVRACLRGRRPMDSLKSRFEKFEQDHELAERVSAELHYDPSIAGADHVDVSAAGGVVMLEGRVDSLAQHWAMERAASRVAGVKGVINGL